MAKPGEINYDFSKLDESSEFQEAINISTTNAPDKVDLEKCREGSKLFNQRFTKPFSHEHIMERFNKKQN